MKHISQHVFAQVPSIKIPRSVFDTSCTYKTTFDSGKLIPFFCREVLPGDTFNVSVKAFARLTTPIVPFMDNLWMDFQFFYCPNRLVWDNWKKFCGEQDNPGDSIDYLVPVLKKRTNPFAVGGVPDYFGLPTRCAGISDVNSLPFRCYNLIWNEWYRPQDLVNSATVPKGDGPDEAQLFGANGLPFPRFNRLDYFQGCLPSPQRGAGVQIPLFGTAPVVGDLSVTVPSLSVNYYSSHTYSGTELKYLSAKFDQAGGYNTASIFNNGDIGSSFEGSLSTVGRSGVAVSGSQYVDLDNASNMTINALREAFQVQLFKEREQLAGSRYREIILSMFGVKTSDASLQVPEFLGAGTLPIQVHAVAQTSATSTDGTPQGNLAAYGVAGGKPVGFVKSFTEHGYIIGLVSVRSDLTYQQGMDRMWSRRTRFDFYWPAFAHLGEQAVLNKEIFTQGDSVTDSSGNIVDNQVFGYQERFAEYRYGRSMVTGKLRSGVTGSLDVWHLAQNYSSLPVLGSTFAQVNVPLSRVLAVTSEPQFIFDSVINCRCARPMPLYGQPGRIDHFF